jgi:hypothetical protein
MATAKRLSNRRLALVEDLSAGDLDEQQVLDRHDVGRQIYYRWLGDRQFVEEVNQRVAGAYRRRSSPIARNARSAAATLVRLANSENPETARKACLDIITMKPLAGLTGAASQEEIAEPSSISPQAASRLLAVLAEEKSQDS